MFRKNWDFVIFILVLTNALIECSDLDPRGKAYTEDKLVGRPDLLSNGNVFTPTGDQDYTSTLLLTEGSYLRYSNVSGYYLGFQWYTPMTSFSKRINIQVYTPVNPGENYTLVKETGWIESTDGYNLHYFEEALMIDEYRGRQDYVLGFTTWSNQTGPLVYQEETCNDRNRFFMTSTSLSVPAVGDTVSFQNVTSTAGNNQCWSFSIQGIFLETNYASQISRNCQFIIAKEDNQELVFSHMPYPANGYPRPYSKCWIVRAVYPDKVIKIRNLIFDLPDIKECNGDSIQLGDEYLLSDPEDYNLWGSFCGDSLFDTKRTGRPYLDISISTHGSGELSRRYYGFIFSVQAVDGGLTTTQIVLLAVLIPVAVIILLIIVVAIYFRKKRKSSSENLALT